MVAFEIHHMDVIITPVVYVRIELLGFEAREFLCVQKGCSEQQEC